MKSWSELYKTTKTTLNQLGVHKNHCELLCITLNNFCEENPQIYIYTLL